ncbi:SAM-dependent methyltransferase [Peribacillus muralis]|uniref:SAM-dependent methyltransferase n=1 Tax=Peribacillus muralis TaxID=264697 RepID=UPI00070CFE0B|nr:SAM-dependent methyltransferase [Peribacillus muralis]
MSLLLEPIGLIKNDRVHLDDDYWGEVISEIILDRSKFKEDCLFGLEQFSHIEVIFYMNKVEPEKIQLNARHPRNRTDWPKVGIFSQRAKARPNQIGVSRCELLKVEGLKMTVRALDAIDQTPVLDIKPYMAEFGPIGQVNQPDWSKELMENYYSNALTK